MVFRSFAYRTNQKDLGGNGSGGNTSGPALGDTINLFMPTSTPAVSNGNGWGEDSAVGPLEAIERDLSVTGARAAMAVGTKDMTVDNIVNGLTSQFNGLKSNFVPALRQAGVGLIGGALGGRSPNALLALSRGVIYNPNIELLYQGPSLRGFNFTFIFAPKSKKEADIVSKIIVEFKKWSAPLAKDGMFEVPAIWQIDYMTGRKKNKNMNAFKRCALTNVSTQDNSSLDYHMSYEEGMPITTTMSLDFAEVDIITRQDHESSEYNRGY